MEQNKLIEKTKENFIKAFVFSLFFSINLLVISSRIFILEIAGGRVSFSFILFIISILYITFLSILYFKTYNFLIKKIKIKYHFLLLIISIFSFILSIIIFLGIAQLIFLLLTNEFLIEHEIRFIEAILLIFIQVGIPIFGFPSGIFSVFAFNSFTNISKYLKETELGKI